MCFLAEHLLVRGDIRGGLLNQAWLTRYSHTFIYVIPRFHAIFLWKFSLHRFMLPKLKALTMLDNNGDAPECGRSVTPPNLTRAKAVLSPVTPVLPSLRAHKSCGLTLEKSKLISCTNILLQYQLVRGEMLSLFQHLFPCLFISVVGRRMEHLVFKGVCRLWFHFHVSKLHGIPNNAGKLVEPIHKTWTAHQIKTLTSKLWIQSRQISFRIVKGLLEWSKMYLSRLWHQLVTTEFRFNFFSHKRSEVQEYQHW